LGKREEARATYRVATERWPDAPLGWLGLGNTEYALGHAAQAESAFRRAVHLQGGSAPAWNNLAYALAARDCIRPAREAARCAQRIAPEDATFTHTLKEMQRMPVSDVEACPPLPACSAD
jgi:tetratricopeptide (TPR) repeat protein